MDEETTVVNPPLIEVDGFVLGENFNSYTELKERMDLHSKRSFVYYWRRDSRTVDAARMKTSRKIAKRLFYYSVRYACIYGGQKYSTRGDGRRNTHSIRKDCPAHIMLRASKSGETLQVISVCNKHNHEISEDISKSLPQNRKLPPLIKKEVQEMLRLNFDRKLIIEYVKLKVDKQLTSKDLFNLSACNKDPKFKINTTLGKEILARVQEFIEQNRPKSMEFHHKHEQFIIPSVNQENISISNDEVLYKTEKPNYVESSSTEEEQVNNEIEFQKYNDYIDEITDNSTALDNEIENIQKETVQFNSEILIFNDDIIISHEEEAIDEFNSTIFLNDVNGENDDIQDYLIETLDQSLTEEFVDNFKTSMETCPLVEVKEKPFQEARRKLKLRRKIKNEIHRTKRRILNCRMCGTNARLINMQLDLMKLTKKKLIQETRILKLQKTKLLIDIRKARCSKSF